MSLISNIKDFFLKRRERKIARLARHVGNPKTIREDRIYALEFFADLDDPETSIPVLLTRFEFSLEHGINDVREKEIAMGGIVRHGDRALNLIRDHLKKTTRIAWPIKALVAIANEQTVSEVLLDVLNYEDVSFDQAIVDKNYDILCHLASYKVGHHATKLTHFLKDPDERVRFACIEALAAQEDERFKSDFEPFLIDSSNENRRIRAVVLRTFSERDWRVESKEILRPEDGLLADGYFLTKKGKVEFRG